MAYEINEAFIINKEVHKKQKVLDKELLPTFTNFEPSKCYKKD